MGLLDVLLKGITYLIERGGDPGGEQLFDLDPQDFKDSITQKGESYDSIVTAFLGDVTEQIETDLTEEFRQGDYIEPDGVEGRVNAAEADAVSYALGNIVSSLVIEVAGLTQLESHQFGLAQITSFLALEDLVGSELAMYMEKGVNPALEAKVARETRSEYASLQDAIEQQLRNKEDDAGWLTGIGTYGIRPDNVPILEEVAIGEIEPEELIEEPVQFGVIPDKATVEAELDRAGLAEGAKDLYLEVVDAMPRSADLWEQRTATEPVVSELDKLVNDGEVTPAEASNYVPAEAEDASQALEDRWRNVEQLPNEAPTRSQLESWFGWGLINRRSLYEGLERTDVDPEKYPAIMGENILSELDGDLRTALGLGLIDENYFSSLAKSLGLEQDVVRDVMAGDDLDDIAIEKASEDVPLSERPTTAVIDISTSRAAALSGEDIETVGDLAQADVQVVAEAAALTDESARTIISRAESMVS
jgi:hypothetical protein